MTEYALVRDGEVVAYRNGAPETDQSTLAAGKPRWFPVEVEGFEGETFDPVSEVREGPDIVVEATRVVRQYAVRAKNGGEIEAMQAAKHAAIEAEFQTRWQLPIEHVVDGETYAFHADQEAVDNIMGIALLIACGVSVPNPRPWTPVGQFTPVDVTHAELIGLGAAIAGRKDALFVLKKTAQAAVAALTDPADIDAFDVTDCWE